MSDWIKAFEDFATSKWKTTKLSESDEKEFRSWFKDTKLFNSIKEDIAKDEGLPVSALDNKKVLEMIVNSKDYDYRGAWKAGIEEQVSPYDNKVHWPSAKGDKFFKAPNHPTTWKEFFMRQYKVDPDELNLQNINQAIEWTRSKTEADPRTRRRPLLNNW